MSAKFKDLFPDYQTYRNEDFLMNEVTDKLLKEITYKISKHLRDAARTKIGLNLDGTLKNMCDVVSTHTNMDKTRNWGWDYITQDFEDQMLEFQNVKFHKFMDCIIDLKNFNISPLEELNDIFEEHHFGYKLTNDIDKPWICINPDIGMAVEIDEVIASTKDICKQTASHIKQAKEQLLRATEPRARKDAIRDCLSAMEALMKRLTSTNDLRDADKVMRADSETWGPRVIVVEGILLWNVFHNDYPDVRHGVYDISKITYEEAIYFVERILAFVKFISTRMVDDKEVEFLF